MTRPLYSVTQQTPSAFNSFVWPIDLSVVRCQQSVQRLYACTNRQLCVISYRPISLILCPLSTGYQQIRYQRIIRVSGPPEHPNSYTNSPVLTLAAQTPRNRWYHTWNSPLRGDPCEFMHDLLSFLRGRQRLSAEAVVVTKSTENKTLSCRRETARRFVSLNNFARYSSRSLKVIRNDTVEYGVWKSLLVFHWNLKLCRTVSEIFSVKE